jgi:hypothetical protein
VVACSYQKLPNDVKPGSQILCSDGTIVMVSGRMHLRASHLGIWAPIVTTGICCYRPVLQQHCTSSTRSAWWITLHSVYTLVSAQDSMMAERFASRPQDRTILNLVLPLGPCRRSSLAMWLAAL